MTGQGFGLEAVNCGEVTRKINASLTRFAFTDLLAPIPHF